jgi:hypothetical protein
MPFDFVKTQMQKEGYRQEKTFILLKNFYTEHGINVLYTGWPIKMIQYILQSVFTVVLLDRLENKSKDL